MILDAYEHYPQSKIEDLRKWEEMSLETLFEELDGCSGPEGEYNWEKASLLTRVIAIRLRLSPTEDINEGIVLMLKNLREAIVELSNRFENHRHDKEASYSEKPVW